MSIKPPPIPKEKFRGKGRCYGRTAAYEMYFPEVLGRSDGGKFTVTSAK